MIGVGLSIPHVAVRGLAASPPPDPQAVLDAYVGAMTVTPDLTRKALLKTLFTSAINNGWWMALDWFVLLASHDAQAGRVNARNPAKVCGLVNAPTFELDRGYTGDGATSYISSGEPWISSPNFQRDSATIGAWYNLDGASAGVSPHIGQVSTTATRIRAQNNGSNSDDFAINDPNTNNLTGGARTFRTGHRTAVRISSLQKRGFYNGAVGVTATVTSTTPSASNGCVLRASTAYTLDRCAAFYTGGTLTDAQVASLHADLNTFLTAIGAN